MPDHSAFSRARHERFRDGQAYRQLFEHVVAPCLARGRVGGAGFSVDASLIRADVNLAKQADGAQPVDWPDEASRAVREHLAARDETALVSSEPHRRAKQPPKAVSLTDPLAAWVTKKYARPFFAYDADYLIDHACGIIVDAEGTCANRRHEIAAARTMLDRVGRRFDLKPSALAGDSVYGAGRLLTWLIERGIEPHVPVWEGVSDEVCKSLMRGIVPVSPRSQLAIRRIRAAIEKTLRRASLSVSFDSQNRLEATERVLKNKDIHVSRCRSALLGFPIAQQFLQPLDQIISKPTRSAIPALRSS